MSDGAHETKRVNAAYAQSARPIRKSTPNA
jgi:hypothetical protein